MNDREDTLDLFATPRQQEAVTPAPTDVDHPAPATLGGKLRAAREARGMTVAECAQRLHLPIKTLQRLEADDFGEPEHFVFLRGALQGYTRFLGLPAGSCVDALRAVAPVEQPALVAVARTSSARWLLQRYGTAATYIVLTATIAVPLVWLGLRGGLERPAARIVSLDQAPATTASAPDAVAARPAKPDETPFRASMTPFAAIGLGDIGASAPAVPVSPVQVPPAVAGPHTLALSARGECWFEITDASGNKVDSGTLRPGESRTWHSAGPLHVTLGNATGVIVTSDGQMLSLEPYRRANVARFAVFTAATDSGENH